MSHCTSTESHFSGLSGVLFLIEAHRNAHVSCTKDHRVSHLFLEVTLHQFVQRFESKYLHLSIGKKSVIIPT